MLMKQFILITLYTENLIFCFYKGPPNFTGICADRPDKDIVQMQAQFGTFNLFRHCLSLNIAFDAFLHRVSIAGLKLPLGTNSSPK